MAIDIRATVTCSLGTLISASVSDDYVQGTGLIKTKGSCELDGIYTPAIGTAVTFSYTKGGTTRQVPRKLRVLSSFADPFRRTTRVELGCKLTYLQDLQEPINWDAFDDPENAGLTEEDARLVTIPIRAKSIMNKCLTELGISASSTPLTSKFSVANFDFGGGYVNVLSDLLLSESYCGYLNTDEVLQIFSLDQAGGTGPVIDQTKLIDLGPIGVGQLPGEAVIVSYSTLKLKQPDSPGQPGGGGAQTQGAERLWEESTTIAGPNVYSVGDKTFTGNEEIVTRTEYEKINGKDMPVLVTTIETGSTAKIAGSIGAAYEEMGIGFSPVHTELRKTVVTINYDAYGNRERAVSTVLDQRLAIFGGVSLDYVAGINDYVAFPNGLIDRERTVTEYERIGKVEREVTSTYRLWPLTIPGQQAVAERRQYLADTVAVATFVNKIADSGLVHDYTTTTLNAVGTRVGRPTELLNAAYAKGGDPDNGWRTESTAELELALGSATAQRRIEFSIPMPPDDVFSGPSGGPFTGVASDAPEKARRYGRSQNRLLLGNRSGMNAQMAPECLPPAPFAPFVVQANGLSALYRTNGTSWQMDANGILASTDALFWGAVGGTGQFFFPVAPGITTLPTAPTVINTAPSLVLGTVESVGVNPQFTLNTAFPTASSGQGAQDLGTDEFWTYNGSAWVNVGATPGPTVTTAAVIPVWNETAIGICHTSTKLQVTSLPYALSLLTEVAVATRTALLANKIVKVDVPVSTLAVAGFAPTVATGAAVKAPTTSATLSALAPAIAIGASVQVPAVSVEVTAGTPSQAGPDSLTVNVPLTSTSVAVLVPSAVGVDLDSYYSSLYLQIYGWDRDFQVDWWAD